MEHPPAAVSFGSINSAVAIANPITLSGYGPTEAAGNLGAIRFLAGSSYTGPVTLAGNASLNPQGSAATIIEQYAPVLSSS